MADIHTIEVLRPGEPVLKLLESALAHEIRAYVLDGGNRDFKHETVQDAAKIWLASVASASKEKDRG